MPPLFRARACLFLLLAAAFCALPVRAAPAPGTAIVVPDIPLSGEATKSVLARLRDGMKNLSTLRADFTQQKHLAMFSRTLVSQGKLSFRAPDSLRWEYTNPVRSGFIVSGGKGAAWSAAAGEMHKTGLKENPEFSTLADQISIWLTFDEEAIRRQYTVEAMSEDPPIIRLTPKSDAVRRFLRHLVLIFAPDGSHAREVRIMEGGTNGDTTVLRFSNTVRGEILPDSLFTP